jgi:hypothetical protein
LYYLGHRLNQSDQLIAAACTIDKTPFSTTAIIGETNHGKTSKDGMVAFSTLLGTIMITV